MSDFDRELGWDDVINKESDFILLPEGDYDFRVESFERQRFEGSQYTPPCNMAVLRLAIDTPDGTASIQHRLYLHSSREAALSAFFLAIGQKKKDEPLRMNWNAVPGSTGRAHIVQKPDKNDASRVYNNVSRFYPKEPKRFEAGRF